LQKIAFTVDYVTNFSLCFRLAVAHHCTRSGGKEEVLLINAVTKEKKNLVCPPSHQNRVFNPDAHAHKNSLGKILLHDGKVKDGF
jgi:hypothetical protein